MECLIPTEGEPVPCPLTPVQGLQVLDDAAFYLCPT